jgi:hypothetical protein
MSATKAEAIAALATFARELIERAETCPCGANPIECQEHCRPRQDGTSDCGRCGPIHPDELEDR